MCVSASVVSVATSNYKLTGASNGECMSAVQLLAQWCDFGHVFVWRLNTKF